MCIVMNAFPVSVTCYILVSRCFHLFFPYRSLSVFPFPVKCFYSQFTGSKVLIDSSSVFPPQFPPSRAPLHTRRARVSIYVSFFVFFPFHLPSSVHGIFFLSSSHGLPFSFLLSPSQFHCVPFLLLSFCRVHNCIIERLFSQLTLSPIPILSHYISGFSLSI